MTPGIVTDGSSVKQSVTSQSQEFVIFYGIGTRKNWNRKSLRTGHEKVLVPKILGTGLKKILRIKKDLVPKKVPESVSSHTAVKENTSLVQSVSNQGG